jgi:hypothetical protein
MRLILIVTLFFIRFNAYCQYLNVELHVTANKIYKEYDGNNELSTKSETHSTFIVNQVLLFNADLLQRIMS